MPQISPPPSLKPFHHFSFRSLPSKSSLSSSSSLLRSWTHHPLPHRQPFSTSPILPARIPSLASLFTAASAAVMSPSSSTGDTTTLPEASSASSSTTTTSAQLPTTTNNTAKPLLRSSYPEHIVFSPQDFRRADESSDPRFYTQPRFVQHIDDGAIAALKSYYAGVIPVAAAADSGGGEGAGGVPDGARVLDLCSSWTSHLPDGLRSRMAACVGYGLNAKEMAANEHLTGWWVRDFNAGVVGTGEGGGGGGGGGGEGEEGLLREIQSGTIDVVICNVSVDYLVEPLRVLEEVKRCLKVGGTAHMAFSNRCFPTKVIGKWLKMGDEERRRWVGSYFWAVGGFEDVEEVILKDGRGWNDPLFVVRARKSANVK